MHFVGKVKPLDRVADDLFEFEFVDPNPASNILTLSKSRDSVELNQESSNESSERVDNNESTNSNTSNNDTTTTTTGGSNSNVSTSKKNNNPIYIYRETQMYQWREYLRSDTNKKFGVKQAKSPVTSTNFNYKHGWYKSYIDSSRFSDASFDHNPKTMPLSQEFYTTQFTINDFVFNLSLVFYLFIYLFRFVCLLENIYI